MYFQFSIFSLLPFVTQGDQLNKHCLSGIRADIIYLCFLFKLCNIFSNTYKIQKWFCQWDFPILHSCKPAWSHCLCHRYEMTWCVGPGPVHKVPVPACWSRDGGQIRSEYCQWHAQMCSLGCLGCILHFGESVQCCSPDFHNHQLNKCHIRLST